MKLLGLAKGCPKGYNIIGILLIKHYIMAAFLNEVYYIRPLQSRLLAVLSLNVSLSSSLANQHPLPPLPSLPPILSFRFTPIPHITFELNTYSYFSLQDG